MRKDLVSILQYASEYNMGLKLSTNGTLINERVLKKIEDTNVFGVQVSLDGTEKTHDTLRNHKKAYQNAVRAIKLFTESNYYTVVAPVVTRMNINEIDYVLETAIQLGASAFKPSIFMPSGRGMNHIQDLYLPKGDIKGLMAKLATKKEEYKADIDIQIDAMYPETESNCGKNEGLDNANEAVGCSAGNTQVVFTATGTVVACPFLYDFVAGDLRRESLRSIWHNSSVLMKFRNL